MIHVSLLLCQFLWTAATVAALAAAPESYYTSAVIKVCYDGTLFHGWSASNNKKSITNVNKNAIQEPRNQKRTRSRRNKLRPSIKLGEVRSVEHSIQCALAKLYGNVPVDKIVVEGSSRTDKGVHSESSYALIYCIRDDAGPLSIQGKKLPHPRNPYDEAFQELPFKSDLQQLVSTLNKMLPPDVRYVYCVVDEIFLFDGTANC
jgi:tRNA U38,U39,U40 pseudouridine synthase TruA